MIRLTENAVKRAKSLLEKTGKPGGALRIRVTSGGCSGFEYKVEPDFEAPQTRDSVTEFEGLKVYMDPKAILYMAGSELDYVSGLMASGFKVKNPQAVAECSCGQSFTV